MTLFCLPDLLWMEIFRDWLVLGELCNVDIALSMKGYAREVLSSFYDSPFFQSIIDRDLSEFSREVDHKVMTFLDWLKLRNCRVEGVGVTVDSYDLSDAKVYPFVTRCNFTSFLSQQMGVESHMTEMFAAFPNLRSITFGLNVTLGLVRKLSCAPSSYHLTSIRFMHDFQTYHSAAETSSSILQLIDRYKNSIELFETVDYWDASIMQFVYRSCPKIKYIHNSTDDTVTSTVFMDCLQAAASRLEEIFLHENMSDMDIATVSPDLTSLRRIDLSATVLSGMVTFRSFVALFNHCRNLEFASYCGLKVIKWRQCNNSSITGFDLQIHSNQCEFSSPSDVCLLLSVLPPLHTLTLSCGDEDIATGLLSSAAASSLQNLQALCLHDQAVSRAHVLLQLLSECRHIESLYLDDVSSRHLKALSPADWNNAVAAIGTFGKSIRALHLCGIRRMKTSTFNSLIAEMPALRRIKIDNMSIDSKTVDRFIRDRGLLCRLCPSSVSNLLVEKDSSIYSTFLYPFW